MKNFEKRLVVYRNPADLGTKTFEKGVFCPLKYFLRRKQDAFCFTNGQCSFRCLTITVLSAVAEIERENILVQTMEGRKQKAREGKWNGGQAPLGYTLDSKNSTLIINPEEAALIKLIYKNIYMKIWDWIPLQII